MDEEAADAADEAERFEVEALERGDERGKGIRMRGLNDEETVFALEDEEDEDEIDDEDDDRRGERRPPSYRKERD
jgi:hypothetical protein